MNKLLDQVLQALKERKLTLKAIAEYALDAGIEINSRTFSGAIEEVEAMIIAANSEELKIDNATVSNVSNVSNVQYINALDDKEYFDSFDCSCRANYGCYITLSKNIFDWSALKYNDCFHDEVISFEINPFLDKYQIRSLINDLIDIFSGSVDGSEQSIALAKLLIEHRSFNCDFFANVE